MSFWAFYFLLSFRNHLIVSRYGLSHGIGLIMNLLHFLELQLPLPEEPDTDDEAEIKKWKWKVRALKKENSERHSQRCDIELKLAVSSFPFSIPVALIVLQFETF